MAAAHQETQAVFSLTRNGNPIASVALASEATPADELTAISELQTVGFAVANREPDTEYSVTVGDVPLAAGADDSVGMESGRGEAFGTNVLWRDGLHLESTRGRVRIHLLSREAGGSGSWSERVGLDVNVVPTKMGELRCEAMEEDIRRIASGLIFDLVSKMLRGVRYADGLRRVSSRSSQLELRALQDLWSEIEGLIRAIDASPELRIERRTGERCFTGVELLDSAGVGRLAARGYDPRIRRSGHSMMIPSTIRTQTSDTPEHRLLLGFVELLLIRVGECISAARTQTARIENDRALRDVVVGPGPTLYQAVDLPRLERLRQAIESGRALAARLRQAIALPVFRGVRPRLGEPNGPVFRHVESYFHIAQAMRRYLASSLVVLEQGEDERLKETSRLYEHWIFIQLAEGFRAAGPECDDLQGLIRRLSRHRFTLDLDDEIIMTFRVDERHVVRLRYEPWVFPIDAARRRFETICRGGSGPAWAPDILVEFLEANDADPEEWDVAYAVVIDAKYSRSIQDHHWSRVTKYSEIRSVASRRQVVRQVWLAHPGESDAIRCRDQAVTWTPFGPDRPRDETIFGTLSLTPRIDTSAGADEDADSEGLDQGQAHQFALGLLAYTRFLPLTEPDGMLGVESSSFADTGTAQAR